MSQQPARRRAASAGTAAGGRPTLFIVATCGTCREQVAQVRDREGQPVLLALGADGKALRDPDGPWWAAKFGGQWRVVRPAPGEDPPAGGWRYAEHGCGGAVQLLTDRLGAEPVTDTPTLRPAPARRRRPAAAPAVPAAPREHPPDRRSPVWVDAGRCPMGRECGCCMGPKGFGHFDPDKPPGKRQIKDCRLPHPVSSRDCRLPYPSVVEACPERRTVPQHRGSGPPAGRCCTACGRVTERIYVGDALPWAKGVPLPWCGGQFPDAAPTSP